MSRHIAVIGGAGFVGSAFVAYFATQGVDVVPITRVNLDELWSRTWDFVVNAAGNSRKWLAERDPIADFDLSVRSTAEVLARLRTHQYVHLSSIDVYNNVSDAEMNRESALIVADRLSPYGFSKYLAELLVRRYGMKWLIVRLGGMVGRGLKKNAIFDLLNGLPLRVHPDSAYQYLDTADVAREVWALAAGDHMGQVFNVCGDGVVRLNEVQAWLGLTTVDNALDRQYYDVNIEKAKALVPVPKTRVTVKEFIDARRQARDSVSSNPVGDRAR